MTLEDARQIAKYVVPRLLFELPQDMKVRLVRPQENEDSVLSRLVESAASVIQRRATQLEQDADPARRYL